MGITLHVAREGAANHPPQEGGRTSQSQVRVPLQSEDQWHQLDQFDLENLFSLRVPMLKACPHFLRSRFRECMGVALRERFRAKQAGDVDTETRAWKLRSCSDDVATPGPEEQVRLVEQSCLKEQSISRMGVGMI